MKMKLTRRRFGQMAIASTAVAGLGYFASKTFAQTKKLGIVGVRPGVTTSTSNAATTIDSTEIDPTAAGGAASTQISADAAGGG